MNDRSYSVEVLQSGQETILLMDMDVETNPTVVCYEENTESDSTNIAPIETGEFRKVELLQTFSKEEEFVQKHAGKDTDIYFVICFQILFWTLSCCRSISSQSHDQTDH